MTPNYACDFRPIFDRQLDHICYMNDLREGIMRIQIAYEVVSESVALAFVMQTQN